MHRFVETYIRQFNKDTKAINVTNNFNGNMTSYILKTSAIDIGDFNTKNLIAFDMKNTAKDDCK